MLGLPRVQQALIEIKENGQHAARCRIWPLQVVREDWLKAFFEIILLHQPKMDR